MSNYPKTQTVNETFLLIHLRCTNSLFYLNPITRTVSLPLKSNSRYTFVPITRVVEI